jgi:uncharacterized protein
MLHSKFRIQYLLFLFNFISIYCFAQKQVPELWGQRVHDEAHALKPETIDALESKLKIFEDSTSNQVAILIVQSLDGDVIEDYSLRVAEKWKLGQKEKDNGVLLLVAIDDHKMRIEVGQGLQGALTDAQSNRIIRDEMAPNFRRGDYDAGLTVGIDKIFLAIKGEYKAEEASDTTAAWIIFGVLFALTCIGILVVTFVREFRGIRKGGAKQSVKTSSSSTESTYTSSSFSSDSSSDSFSDSSFSGGGGSFDGGGSSGSW